MTFDDDFSKNSWESIKKACELGVAYKMWPGKKEKTLKDTVTGEENIIECDGLFVSIGRKPTTDFLDNQIELDNKGYIVAGENTETSIPGVYAVGDVRTKLLRQIVTAVADGAMAVHMAEEYVEK